MPFESSATDGSLPAQRAMMKRRLSIPPRFFCFFALALSSVFSANALELRAFHFERVGVEGGGDPWYEVALEIYVESDSEDRSRSRPEFVDSLRIELFLGFEVSHGVQGGFEFYESEVEIVSAAQGAHRIRFYLPAEIVERDRIRGEPFAYLARLYAAGEPIGEWRSEVLEDPRARASFLERIEQNAPENDGVLVHQSNSPFANSYPNSTPTARLGDGMRVRN